jgi:GT2 family glycosyltransferase
MKITIGIPVYITQDLHAEFTEKTVHSIKTQYEHEVIILINYCKPEFLSRMEALGTVIMNNDGNCLGSSWNEIIDYGKQNKSDYILLSNNDLIFHPDCIDNLIKFAQEHIEYSIWSAGEWKGQSHEETNKAIKSNLEGIPIGEGSDDHPHFSCFMVDRYFTDILAAKEEGTKEPKPGYFDPNIRPAYFEDGDMHERLLRADMKAGKTATALFYHYGSRTIAVDDEIDIANKQTYEKNRAYFISKWGFDPHSCVLGNDAPERFAYKGPFEK